ncbi:MAG: hypothetical protein WCO58_03230 [bacterium]
MLQTLRKKLLFTILIVWGLNTLAHKFYWYSSIWWFDMPMHFLGGYFLGLLMLLVIAYTDKQSSNREKIIITLLGVFAIGVMWEGYEYAIQILTGSNLANPLDSTSDLFFDMAGGTFSLILLRRLMLK